MAFQCLNVNAQIQRPLANFHPEIWGDRFINYSPPNEATRSEKEKEAMELQQLVRKELKAIDKDPKQRLVFIDAIQRLGVAYHFEKDIEELLNNFHNMLYYDREFLDDLQYVSLRFRLLRQHGFYTSGDVFNKFKKECGTFNEALASNIQGMLDLYEASYLRVHGEKTLDEALQFTTHHLTSFAKQLISTLLTKKINHALKRPLQRCTTRMEAKYQISFYELDHSHDKILIRFAKLDFDLLQIFHKQELQYLTRWWKNLDLASKLPFARSRLVECYLWFVSIYPEPIYSFARLQYTKMLKIISLLDDIYDAYGTIEELEHFSAAIQRWDKTSMNELPNYMTLVYKTILETMDLLQQELDKQGRSYAIHYLQREWKKISTAYMQEAKWCFAKFVPSFDEYIRNGIVTSTYPLIMAITYQYMDIASEKAFEWLQQLPKCLVGSCMMGRILNDLATHKFEQTREHVATSIECYVKQFCVSEEEACKKLQEMVDDCWKDITHDMFRPTKVAMPLLIKFLELSRITNETYNNNQDRYTMSNIIQAEMEELFIHNFNTMI